MTTHEPTFQHVLGAFLAELTPQPWGYGTPGGTRLTVAPAGLRADAGCAEVTIHIAASRTLTAEIGITTTDMPGLIDALTTGTDWSHTTVLGDVLTVTAADLGGVVLTATEADWEDGRRVESTTAVRVPEEQRLPLASALRRATDVARGWEDEPDGGEA